MTWVGPARAACALGAFAASLLAGCSPFGGGQFACTDTAQCGPDGTCEPNGLCSFPDPSCDSGRRYGDAAGALSGVCVGSEPPPDAPPGTPDAPADAPPGTPDALPDAPSAPLFCDPADPTLRLCLELEGNATDGSGAGNTPATTAITFVPGQVGMAVATTGTSRIDIAETPSLDITRITVEAWVRPAQLPGGGGARAGIVDDNGEWGVFIVGNDDVRCTLFGGVTAQNVLAVGTWTHVACTYDGAEVRVYIDGAVAATLAATGDIGTGGQDGTSLAGDSPPGPDRFVGELDQFRIFSVARSAAEICAAAGQTSCP